MEKLNFRFALHVGLVIGVYGASGFNIELLLVRENIANNDGVGFNIELLGEAGLGRLVSLVSVQQY